MASRPNRRADRIRDQIPITEVLHNLGYRVNPGAGDREQQFSCDLHGDGRDGSPSARAYPASNSWYCFGCGATRDAIQTVREKMGMSFGDACAWLEKGWKLGPLPWDEETRQEYEPARKSSIEDAWREQGRFGTFAEAQEEAELLLARLTKGRFLPMDDTLALWEVFDQIRWLVGEGKQWDESKGRESLLRMTDRVLSRLRERMLGPT